MKFIVKRTCVNVFLQTRKKVFKHVCQHTVKHICIQTYLQATKKRDIKKERKIVFKHTNLQTFKRLLCKREKEAQ